MAFDQHFTDIHKYLNDATKYQHI